MEEVNHHSLTPIFIFSLPRSGSTLLQRLLATHDQVSTASEPWLLLPCLYALREKGAYAEYGHRSAAEAISDFCTLLPHGRLDYLEAVRKFSLDIYCKASSSNAKYFVDKTPRYHLIVDDIINAFPDGKFIFLWRHPLSVAASIIETWGGGKWNLFGYKVDLYSGLENLVEAHTNYQDRAISLCYEDVVVGKAGVYDRLFDYLGLEYGDVLLKQFAGIDLSGRMGDVTGRARYQSVSSDPLLKWRETMANPVRTAWCRRYLNWIGEDRLAAMGYELQAMQEEVAQIHGRHSGVVSDLARIAYGAAYCAMEPHIVRDQLRFFRKWHKIHVHT
ncbi:MAG: sulfotransferase [Mariprofundaceae bacterium]